MFRLNPESVIWCHFMKTTFIHIVNDEMQRVALPAKIFLFHFGRHCAKKLTHFWLFPKKTFCKNMLFFSQCIMFFCFCFLVTVGPFYNFSFSVSPQRTAHFGRRVNYWLADAGFAPRAFRATDWSTTTEPPHLSELPHLQQCIIWYFLFRWHDRSVIYFRVWSWRSSRLDISSLSWLQVEICTGHYVIFELQVTAGF